MTPSHDNGSAEPPKPLTTGEVAKLQVEAKKEDAKRTPASHWDLVKSTVAILGTLAGIVLGFVTFGDRVVARAEGKTADGVKVVKDDLREHIADEAKHHEEVKSVFKDFAVEMREQRADIKALYRAMPGRRMQARLENDVVEPREEEVRRLGIPTDEVPAPGLSIIGPVHMPTPMPRPRPDAGR